MRDPAPRQSGVEQISRIRPSLPYAHTALIALLVCAGYYLGAELAFMLRIPSTRSAIIWVPNAVLLAVLLLTPPRTWAIWFLAALPAHLVAQSRDGGFVLVLLYPFFANVAQVIIAAMGLRCLAAAPPRFNILRDMTLFVLIAAITAPALISFLAAWLFVSVGWETDFWLVSRGRFLNNMTTGLTVAPLILMAAESGLAGLRRRRGQRYVEFALLAVGLGGTLYLTHTWTTVGAGSIPLQLYAPLPFLLWAAVRFGPGGLCLFLLVVAAHAISGTISGRGPYVAQTPAENVLTLQISLAVLAIPLMFVAALIGERRKKEEALRESEERFRWMGDAIPDVIWFTALEPEKILYVSPSFERIWGLPVEDLYRNPRLWTETILPEDRDHVNKTFARWIAGEKVNYHDIEYRIIQPNGAIRWIHERGVLRLNDQGKPYLASGISTDITERKQAEQRLIVQHTVTQMLATAATLEEVTPKILQAVCKCLVWDLGELWCTDRAAGVLRWVEVWHKESIEAPQFVATSRDRTFMPGIGLPGRVWSSREPAYIPDVVQDSNFRRASIAAREGLHAAFGFPILLGSEVVGVMDFFSQDIRQPDQDLLDMMATIGSQIGQFIERKRAEEAFHTAQMELAHVTRVATLGEMTASIAHEINQPLGALVNNAGACLGWLDAENLEEARNSVALMMDDAQRASEIITRIRALVKKAPPQKDWLEINQTIREVIGLARNEMQRNGVALETQLSDDMPLIFADRIQLQQVMLNLMMNAIEAMTQVTTPRELLISSEADDSKGVVVVVRDSGPGLDSKSLERLFEPFYTTKPQGMGMGLAICRSIVQAHGGRLWAATNRDRGASFHFSLPTGEELA